MIIPFFIPHAGCPHQCVFCDQKRITGRTAAPDPSDVPGTIRSYLSQRKTDDGGAAPEVAFYGGSFTALPSARQQAYLDQVRPFLGSGGVSGIRVSTRPDAVAPGVLSLLRDCLVSTVELGAQSMDDEVLLRSGRGHRAVHTRQATGLLKEHGFRTGIQLMPGLPGDSPAVFRRTVDEVIGLRPDFVRIYPALVIKGTPLERLWSEGSYRPFPLDETVELCADALERLRQAGIGVRRIGLQRTGDLDRPGTIVAGPWHPAFGQLVASRLFLRRMRTALSEGRTGMTLLVHPKDLSTALGQRRANMQALQEAYGRKVRVQADPTVPRGEVR
jgi:histone acetyltransferase (RNA polymerase elongator complex component)